ncbi:MAG TPA: mercuric transporter MerT family protein [Casimicrobiaceae bacterium]
MPSLSSRSSLIAGSLAAVGASLCCVAPLVLLSLGIGGAWIANLTALEPYRPALIGVTFLFLALAFRKLYLVPRTCVPDARCADTSVIARQRIIFWVVVLLLLALLAFPWVAQFFL